MLISLNKLLIGKPKSGDDAWSLYSDTFEACDISLQELANFINKGYAFCSQYKKQKRESANFEAAGFLAVDIEKKLTISAVANDPFFQKYGGLIYSTTNHTPWNHRFRVVFELESPITDEKHMKHAVTGLIHRYQGDAACKDACRMFCGSVEADEVVLLGNKLPNDVLESLVVSGREMPVRRDNSKGEGMATNQTSIKIPPEQPIQTKKYGWLPFGQLQLDTVVYCPQHTEENASAFVLQSQQGVKGIHCSACCRTYFMETEWDRRRREEYEFNYNWEPALLGQAERLNRDIEIFESETGLKYEPTIPEKQGYGYSHRVLSQHPFESEQNLGISPIFIHLNQRFITAESIALRYPRFTDDFIYDHAKGITMREALLRREQSGEFKNDNLDYIVEEKAILNWLSHEGVTLIKSPKGSGKTELMQHIMQHYDAYDDMPKSVLLIGHRRPLLNASAKRFREVEIDFVSYLKSEREKGDSSDFNMPTQKYAICLDSMPNLLQPTRHKYDVVIIDEVEQVLSHLLSSTMKSERKSVILWLRRYLRQAKHIFLLDADLNTLTADIMNTLIGDSTKDVFYVINTYKPPASKVYLHHSKDNLIGKMQLALLNGKRCFMCSNSKRLVKSLTKEIAHLMPNLKIIEVTGDNSSDENIQFFIKNIKEEAKKYNLIAVSPSMGTGIDITFPGREKCIDSVFGIFESKVNTHFDIDQQLSRVRDPGEINVWISPEKFSFETDANVILSEIRAMKEEYRVIRDIGDDGVPIYYPPTEAEDLYERIYAAVNETRRASMNNLKVNFKKLREANGWDVEDVKSDSNLTQIGGTLRDQAVDKHDAEERRKILDARPITHTEEFAIRNKPSDKQSEEEKNSKQRYDIENFYNMDATDELILMDNKWKFRKAISLYTILLLDDEELKRKDMYRRGEMYLDTKKYRQRADVLKEILASVGYWSESGFNRDAVIRNDMMKPFIGMCTKYREVLFREFDVKLRGDYITKPIQQLGDILKKTLMLGNKKLDEKTRDCRYMLDGELLDHLHDWYEQHTDAEIQETWYSNRISIRRPREPLPVPPEIVEFVENSAKGKASESSEKKPLADTSSSVFSVMDVDDD